MPSTGDEATTNSVEKEQFAGRPVFISTNEKLGSSGSSSANTTPESSAFDPSLHNGTLHNGSLTTSHTRNTNSHSSQLPPPVLMAGAMENDKNHHARQQSLTNSARRRRPRRIYLNKFRVPIYVQLCLVICILCGLCVLVVAVSTYVNDRSTLLQLQGNNLVTIAVLKSVQINQTINNLYNQVFAITTRVMIQRSLINYYNDHLTSNTSFATSYDDLSTAIAAQPSIQAALIYDTDFNPLTNLSVSDVTFNIPASLWPTSKPPLPSNGNVNNSGQLLGPAYINSTSGFSVSLTIPILNTNASSSPTLLGYMSVVFSASGLQKAVNDSTGMGQTGQLLVVEMNETFYSIILPPLRTPQIYGTPIYPAQYPAIDLAFQNRTGYDISTHNAENEPVSVGYTLPSLRFAKWAVLAEETRAEVFSPIVDQQNLAAITTVVPYTAVCLIISLLVIVFVKSIQDLSRANRGTLRAAERTDDDVSSRILPDPVQERTWWFRDEISDVQRSHNIMREQLLKQYESLEEQVRIKTAELHNKMEELEVALARVEEEKMNTQNALQVKEEALSTQERLMHSVAHDLKTPLNGILAPMESWLNSPVFSGDEKAELQDAYLSTKRLKRLTEDLTKYAEDVRFGRLNPQVFTLSVLQNQVQFDFSTQFSEKNLGFSAQFLPEMCADWQVYGDYYRISQVCNNFVQNAVKFTPSGGRVQMRVRALGKLEKPKHPNADGASEHSSSGSGGLFRTPLTDDSNSDRRAKDKVDWHLEYFEFEVEDNGIGIPPEDLSKIFEPWHQLADDKQHSERYGGIGLGLAICQFWITKMDGKIEVTSRRAASVNERGWTIFKVLIPLRVNRLSRRNSTNSSRLSVGTTGSEHQLSASTAAVNRPESPKAPITEITPQSLSEAITSNAPQQLTWKISQKQNCRILIAEDEPINQRVVQRMLTKDGFRRITFARNGFEAIEAVSKAQEAGKQFNLILMDFQMPHVDGPLAATVIRRMPHITQDRLVIIALTAYDDDKSKRDCLEAGMNDFITKPISHATLRDILMKHLSLPSVPEDEDEDDEDEGAAVILPSLPKPSNESPPRNTSSET